MESIFDLPTHTFAVHAPVVLVPLLALATVVALARAEWRRRFAWWLVAALVIVLGAVLFAIASGQAFDDVLAGQVDMDKHESLALTTRNLMFGWLLATIALAIVVRRDGASEVSVEHGDGDVAAVRRYAQPALVLATVVLAVLATIWLVRTGHEGARVTWSGVIPQDD